LQAQVIVVGIEHGHEKRIERTTPLKKRNMEEKPMII
jgi:hypothetical protein